MDKSGRCIPNQNLKKDAKRSDLETRKDILGAIDQVKEAIEKEKREQFEKKISKVVDKLRSDKGINGPNMWEVLKKVKRRKEEPAVSIKDKEGKLLEEPNDVKQRYLEYFGELLQPVKPQNVCSAWISSSF